MVLTTGDVLIFILPAAVSRPSSSLLFPGSVFQASGHQWLCFSLSLISAALPSITSTQCHKAPGLGPSSFSFSFLFQTGLAAPAGFSHSPDLGLRLCIFDFLLKSRLVSLGDCHIHLGISTHIPETNVLISTAKLPPLSAHLRLPHADFLYIHLCHKAKQLHLQKELYVCIC
jgi:hypothetical protein